MSGQCACADGSQDCVSGAVAVEASIVMFVLALLVVL
jgi:hypothetical protein